MHNKFRVTRKLCALFTLCCFVISGCTTTNESNTRATLNFSLATSLATSSTTQASASSTSTITSAVASQNVSAIASPFDLVAQQFAAFVKWRRECNYKPRLCDIGKFTILGTQFSDEFAEMMRDYSKNNIFARPGDGERKVMVETISQDVATMTAIVHGCVYDTVVLYMGVGIYDDKVISSLSSWTMQWRNDSWFWTNYQIHKKVYFENLCNT